MTFSQLGLTAPLLQALDALGYQEPTPVQAQAIPAVLAGRDLMAAAQTGTGKTAGFALPLLQRLSESDEAVASNSIRALVLVPTRELAEQVMTSFRQYGEPPPAHGLSPSRWWRRYPAGRYTKPAPKAVPQGAAQSPLGWRPAR